MMSYRKTTKNLIVDENMKISEFERFFKETRKWFTYVVELLGVIPGFNQAIAHWVCCCLIRALIIEVESSPGQSVLDVINDRSLDGTLVATDIRAHELPNLFLAFGWLLSELRSVESGNLCLALLIKIFCEFETRVSSLHALLWSGISKSCSSSILSRLLSDLLSFFGCDLFLICSVRLFLLLRGCTGCCSSNEGCILSCSRFFYESLSFFNWLSCSSSLLCFLTICLFLWHRVALCL